MNRVLPCIACGTALHPSLSDTDPDATPAHGTAFTAHGNYGSTVFDPFNDDTLRINVCDPCLTRHAATRVQHIRPDTAPRPPVFARPFDPTSRADDL